MAYDGALLANALDVPDRPQSSPQWLLVHHRGRAGLPRLEWPYARGMRDARPSAPGQWLQHVLARQRAQRPGAGYFGGREPLGMAAAEGLRPLLWLPRRRDQPVVPGPRR